MVTKSDLMKEIMERKIIQTNDGSSSIFVPELNENYHSTHGALQESKHVFLKKGLGLVTKKNLAIFEVGFGTGLNALLTFFEGERRSLNIRYHSVEKYPVNLQELKSLNYPSMIDHDSASAVFDKMHAAEWGGSVAISENFVLRKIESDLKQMEMPATYDLVYFDAFAPNKQANMWSGEVFLKLYKAMNPGGLLVTYCAKGSVRRTLIAAGFDVQRTDGPPGKREMLQAFKR